MKKTEREVLADRFRHEYARITGCILNAQAVELAFNAVLAPPPPAVPTHIEPVVPEGIVVTGEFQPEDVFPPDDRSE